MFEGVLQNKSYPYLLGIVAVKEDYFSSHNMCDVIHILTVASFSQFLFVRSCI